MPNATPRARLMLTTTRSAHNPLQIQVETNYLHIRNTMGLMMINGMVVRNEKDLRQKLLHTLLVASVHLHRCGTCFCASPAMCL